MDKEHLLSEIKRTAKENGGKPLGRARFAKETGIKNYDWYGKYWTRWSDALSEAGLSPNQFTVGFDASFLLEKIVVLTRKLSRVPIEGDLLMESRNNPDFPSRDVFRKLGLKSNRISKVIGYCEQHSEYADVGKLWKACVAAQKVKPNKDESFSKEASTGYVYLLKHGSRSEYKIGRTVNPLRREGEVSIQLPEKLQPVHYIETDDPAGIENYWHNRFADKRKRANGFRSMPMMFELLNVGEKYTE